MIDENQKRIEEIEMRWAEGAKGDIFAAARLTTQGGGRWTQD